MNALKFWWFKNKSFKEISSSPSSFFSKYRVYLYSCSCIFECISKILYKDCSPNHQSSWNVNTKWTFKSEGWNNNGMYVWVCVCATCMCVYIVKRCFVISKMYVRWWNITWINLLWIIKLTRNKKKNETIRKIYVWTKHIYECMKNGFSC